MNVLLSLLLTIGHDLDDLRHGHGGVLNFELESDLGAEQRPGILRYHASLPRVLHQRLGHQFLKTVSMSSRQRKGKVISTTKPSKRVSSLQDMPGTHSLNESRGITSSMDTVRVQSRTHGYSAHDTDEVELTLLEEDERRQAAVGVSSGGSARASRQKLPMSTKDKRSMGLLCVLCEFPCCYHGMSLIPFRFDPGRSCKS